MEKSYIYDWKNGVVVDPESGEVIDNLFDVSPTDGFRRSEKNDNPYKALHYSIMLNIFLPKYMYRTLRDALDFLRYRLQNNVDVAELAKIVKSIYLESKGIRVMREAAAAAAIYIYSNIYFNRYIDPFNICIEVGGTEKRCRNVRRIIIRLSKKYRYDRMKVLSNMIDSASDDTATSYIAKLLLRRARPSGSSRVVVAGLIYLAKAIRDEYTTFKEVAEKVDAGPWLIARFVRSFKDVKIVRTRAGAILRIEIHKDLCNEIEKVAKMSKAVVCR